MSKPAFCLGIILAIAGYAFLPCAAFMQENGVRDKITTLIAEFGFFGCNGVGIVLMFKAYPYFVISGSMKMSRKYDNLELFQLQKVDKHSLKETLLKQGFVYTEEGYYRKKKISVLKDYICYYIRMAYGEDMMDIIQQEAGRFDTIEKKEKNACLLLFVYMDRVGEHEKEEMKEFDKKNIILETVINPYTAATIIAIAVDCSTYTGYFLDVVKGNVISLYSHGCKLLKNL